LQALLTPDEALVCYFTTGVQERTLPLFRVLAHDNPLRALLLTQAKIVCFIVTGDNVRAMSLVLDPNALVSQSARGEERRRFLSAGMLRELRRRLIEPLELGEMRRIVLAPHGPLHRVPFAALLDMPVVITPSAHFWLAARTRAPRPHPPTNCLAIGYDGGSEGFALRHTEAEAEFVAELTGGKAWTGAHAKLPQLREVAENVRWLHIACHGSFDEQAPLASYLSTGAGERISALDVLRDWRLKADLTVLSACQSGVSRVLAGDEPLGLMRAFIVAGARGVLASQWQIEDLPTFLLMQRFYTLLMHNPADPASALYAAQRWLATLSVTETRAFLQETGSWKQRNQRPMQGAGSTVSSSGIDLNMLHDLHADAQPFAEPVYWASFVLVGT
jgi:CHAT domain-containing protein